MKTGNPEKKKKLKLQMDDKIHFRLIGISSHENDYRLVWAINNQLSFQFIRIQNLVMHQPKLKTDLEFSRYLHTDEDRYHAYYLISNRCPDGFLFPELKNFDFLMQITGEITSGDTKEFLKKLKEVQVISASFLLEPHKIKGIKNKLQE
jgi:hypothetical protein